MGDIVLFNKTIPFWVCAPFLYFLWAGILLGIKKFLFVWLTFVSRKTQTKVDDLLIDSLDLPLTLLIYISGGAFLERFLPSEAGQGVTHYFLFALKAAIILSVILFLDKFTTGILRISEEKVTLLRSAGGIVHGVVRALIIVVGVLILLDSFGISITPILASLGIGSLAVGLALQPTLENFFSGLQVVTDRVLLIGQFVRLDSGEEGYVEKIGWRATWIRTAPNNMIIVPNKILVSSKLTNYDYPNREISFSISLGVSYSSDLTYVEKVTLEVADEVLRVVPGGASGFKPTLRYDLFGPSSVDFKVTFRVKEQESQPLIRHEFVKRVHERYKKEGIVIPYPVQTLEFAPETVEAVRSAVKGS